MFTYKNNFLMNPFDMTGQGAPTSDGINTPLLGMVPMREVNIFSAGMVPAEGRHVSPNGLLPINGTEMLMQTLSSVNGGLSPSTVAPTNGTSVSDAVSDAPTGTWFQTLSGQEEEQIRGYQCGNTPAQDHEMTYYSGISHAGESPVFLNAAGPKSEVVVSQSELAAPPVPKKLVERRYFNTGLLYAPLNVTGMTQTVAGYGPMTVPAVSRNTPPAPTGKYDAFREDNYFFTPPAAKHPFDADEPRTVVPEGLKEKEALFQWDMEPGKYQQMRDAGDSDDKILQKHKEYDEALIKRFMASLSDPNQSEGYKDFIYLDTMGNMSYGRAKNVNSDAVFLKLPWRDPATGEELSYTEKLKRLQQARAAQQTVLARCAESKRNGTFQGDPDTVVDLTADAQREYFAHIVMMTEADEQKMIKEHLTEHTLPDLKKNFRRLNRPFYAEPPSAQWAEMDLMYNLGPNRFKMDPYSQGEEVKHGWPTLTKSLMDQDFVKAGEASHRSNIGDARNDEIKRHFQNAQKEYHYGVRGGPYYGDDLNDFWHTILDE